MHHQGRGRGPADDERPPRALGAARLDVVDPDLEAPLAKPRVERSVVGSKNAGSEHAKTTRADILLAR